MPCVEWIADGQVPAGFLSRFVISYPSAFFPQRHFAAAQAWQVALQHLQAQQLPLPPNVSFRPYPLSHSEEAPRLLIFQVEQPTVQRAQYNAPYGQPTGNAGGPLPPPPLPTPKGQTVNAGPKTYEPLNESALPATVDSAFGEIDGFGGTFADIDLQGNETVRDPNLVRLSDPPKR